MSIKYGWNIVIYTSNLSKIIKIEENRHCSLLHVGSFSKDWMHTTYSYVCAGWSKKTTMYTTHPWTSIQNEENQALFFSFWMIFEGLGAYNIQLHMCWLEQEDNNIYTTSPLKLIQNEENNACFLIFGCFLKDRVSRIHSYVCAGWSKKTSI